MIRLLFLIQLVENTAIHLVPVMNPDGMVRVQDRGCNSRDGLANAHGVDLSLGFTETSTEPEVLAMKNWTSSRPFSLSIALHNGGLGVSYPSANLTGQVEDRDMKRLAEVYTKHHELMSKGGSCSQSDGLLRNSSQAHSMSSWNYKNGVKELNVFIDCCQIPQPKDLVEIWRQHLDSFMAMLNEVHKGFKGTVKESKSGKAIPKATIKMEGWGGVILGAQTGEFWGYSSPGIYSIKVSAVGYVSKTQKVVVQPHADAVVLEIPLKPATSIVGFSIKSLIVISSIAIFLLAVIMGILLYTRSKNQVKPKGFHRVNTEEYFEDDYLGKTMMVAEYRDNPQDLGHFLPKANSELLKEYRDTETSEEEYAVG